MNPKTPSFSSLMKLAGLGRWRPWVLASLAAALMLARGLMADEFDTIQDDGSIVVMGDAGVQGNAYLDSSVYVYYGVIADSVMIKGKRLFLGDYSEDNTLSVMQSYDDDAGFATTAFTMCNTQNNWIWQQNGPGWDGIFPAGQVQMNLDQDGILKVFSVSGNWISLDPGNQSISFSNGTTFPDVLNLVLYNSGDGGFVAGNGASATGTRSVALGGEANATGNLSAALAAGVATGTRSLAGSGGTAAGNLSVGLANGLANGDLSTASSNGTAQAYLSSAFSSGVAGGNDSVALAWGTSNGAMSLAAGNNSVAGGVNAVALGGGNASADSSLAFGENSLANATGAVVLGGNLTANSLNSITVGHFNANLSGNGTSWVATDPAFVVGTGNSTTHANGLIVQNNGNTTIGGSSAVAGNSTIGGGLNVTGAATVGGSTSITGNLTVSGNVIYSQASGDVSMGVYGVYGN